MQERMTGKPIHVIAINRTFKSVDELASEMVHQARRYSKVPVIFVLPEAVLGEKAISRHEGRNLARSLHRIAASPGKAYFGYSVFEKYPQEEPYQVRTPSIFNAGYFVTPEKEGIGYKAYPKLAMYGNGSSLTDFDESALRERNAVSITDNLLVKNKRRIRMVEGFPKVTINGKDVELRVCADFVDRQFVPDDPSWEKVSFVKRDTHPAKIGMGSHLVIVPAASLRIRDTDLGYLSKIISPKGIAVIVDKLKQRVTVCRKNKKGIMEPPLEMQQGRSFRRGRFLVRHK